MKALLFILTSFFTTAYTNVIFLPRGGVYPSFDEWDIHFPVNIESFWTFSLDAQATVDSFYSKFKSLFDQHESKLRNRLSRNFLLKLETETALLQSEINRTTQTLAEMKNTPSPRAKRAILPFVGQIFKTVIGTATTSDIDEIIKQVSVLRNSQKEVLHILEQGASILNQTTIDVATNRKALNKLTEFTQSLEEKFASLTKLVLRDLVTFTNIGNDMDLIFQNLHTTFQNIRENLRNLELHYSLAKSGILAHSLFPPRIFKKTLVYIQDHLPKSLALPFKPEETEKFYSIAHVGVSRTNNGFVVHIKIPIVQVKNIFQIYQVFREPIPQKFGNKIFAVSYITDSSKFLAVSEDKSKFITLDNDEVQIYLRDQLPFCPFRKPIMNTLESDKCLPALLTQRDSHISQFCEKKVFVNQTDIPTAYYMGNGHWFIITSRPLHVEIFCKNKSLHLESTKKTLTGPIEMLSLDPGCEASCQYFMLPRYYKADTLLPTVFENHVHAQLASLSIWQDVLSELDQHIPSAVHALQSLPPLPNSQATLATIKAHIQETQSKLTNAASGLMLTTVPSGIALLGFIMIAAIVAYKVRPKCITRDPSSCPSQSNPDTPILSGSEEGPTSAENRIMEQPDSRGSTVTSMLTRTGSHAQ